MDVELLGKMENKTHKDRDKILKIPLFIVVHYYRKTSLQREQPFKGNNLPFSQDYSY